jgi:hypothetical protein
MSGLIHLRWLSSVAETFNPAHMNGTEALDCQLPEVYVTGRTNTEGGGAYA